MKLLKYIGRRSFLTELVYVLLNVALAIAVLIIVLTVDSPIPAFILVILSKWRVLAVRPRYWLANIQANAVDFLVSLSVVVLMYHAAGLANGFAVQIILTLLYIVWLVVIKPRSSLVMVVAQAATALLGGVTALFVVSHDWPIEFVVVGMALIGYVTARHALAQYKEDHLQFLALLWAFVMAQFGWLFYHWVIAYSLPFVRLQIPQVTLIVAAVALSVFTVYDVYKRNETVRFADIALPVGCSVVIIAALLIFFNQLPIGAL